MKRFNDWIAIKVTNFVGSMTCAYLFAALAIYGAPGEIKAVGFPTWLAQSFLQLVLLSVIMVGQRVTGERVDQLHDKHDQLHNLLRKDKP